MIATTTYIGPFFYTAGGQILAHRIPAAEGETRGGKLDNPYSHEALYNDHNACGDYIELPRGRVIWDIAQSHAILYTDTCIEQIDGAIEQIAELFGLTDYVVEHDEHYVCPTCMGNIWN